MLLLTLDSQGKLILPPEALISHGLFAGSQVRVDDLGDKITIEPIAANSKRSSLKDLAGFLGPDPKALRTLLEERAADRKKEDGPGRS